MIYETGSPKDYLLASQTVSSGKNKALFGPKNLKALILQKQKRLGINGRRLRKEMEKKFFIAQKFIYETHYQPVLSAILTTTKLDLNNLPKTIKGVIWSTAVQHQKAKNFIVDSIQSIKKNRNMKQYCYDLINSIYDKRIAYVKTRKNISENVKQALINNRYYLERNQALQMIENDF